MSVCTIRSNRATEFSNKRTSALNFTRDDVFSLASYSRRNCVLRSMVSAINVNNSFSAAVHTNDLPVAVDAAASSLFNSRSTLRASADLAIPSIIHQDRPER
jgi:hypothetical protein